MSDTGWLPLPIGGALRIVTDEMRRQSARSLAEDRPRTITLRCPQCGHEAIMDEDQFNGRVSCDHTDCGRAWKPSLCDCTWHETHDFSTMIGVP